MLKEIAPQLARAAVLLDPKTKEFAAYRGCVGTEPSFTVSPSELGARVIPYRIVNAPALRRRGGRVAEDCVMTITSIFLNRLTAEVPTQTWKSFPKRWRAIRRLGRRRSGRS